MSEFAVARFGYGQWINPLPQLLPLLLSANKGLFVYCPACIAFALSFKALWRYCSSLCLMLDWAVAVPVSLCRESIRLAWRFFARTALAGDIHPLIPTTTHALAQDVRVEALCCRGVLAADRCRGNRALFLAFGDYFRFYEAFRNSLVKAGTLSSYTMYLDWETSMLPGLLAGPRAPLLPLRGLPFSNSATFGSLAVLLVVALGATFAWLLLNARARAPMTRGWQADPRSVCALRNGAACARDEAR